MGSMPVQNGHEPLEKLSNLIPSVIVPGGTMTRLMPSAVMAIVWPSRLSSFSPKRFQLNLVN